MTITVYIDELLKDLHEQSRLECLAIQDIEQRYRVQTGTDKNAELTRMMMNAQSAVTRRLNKYLDRDYTDSANNDPSLPESFTWDLEMSERRSSGKAQPLTDAIHDFIVNLTLARYYRNAGAADLSASHDAVAISCADEIDILINSKVPRD